MRRSADYTSTDLLTIEQRQYKLILYTAAEIISLSAIIVVFYAFSKLWLPAVFLTLSFTMGLINLTYLVRSKNIVVCGHLSILITLLTITFGNVYIGGTGTPYSIWYYVIPLLAVSLTGWKNLYFYSGISLLFIVFFGILNHRAVFHLPYNTYLLVEWANHMVAFLVIVTILNSLMRDSRVYEALLHSKNLDLQNEKEKFQYLSRFDHLTSLPNRQYFMQHLQEVMESLSSKFQITIFFMDLDNFKYFNDHYGHDAGDEILRSTANKLQRCFREGDFIARLGGDEFTAIVIHEANESIPEQISMRIQEEFNQNICCLEKDNGVISISVGMATYPVDAVTRKELMKKADEAMYAAKSHHQTRNTQ